MGKIELSDGGCIGEANIPNHGHDIPPFADWENTSRSAKPLRNPSGLLGSREHCAEAFLSLGGPEGG
jgi:hypothetical protein